MEITQYNCQRGGRNDDKSAGGALWYPAVLTQMQHRQVHIGRYTGKRCQHWSPKFEARRKFTMLSRMRIELNACQNEVANSGGQMDGHCRSCQPGCLPPLPSDGANVAGEGWFWWFCFRSHSQAASGSLAVCSLCARVYSVPLAGRTAFAKLGLPEVVVGDVRPILPSKRPK
jgi:hypothetical protein